MISDTSSNLDVQGNHTLNTDDVFTISVSNPNFGEIGNINVDNTTDTQDVAALEQVIIQDICGGDGITLNEKNDVPIFRLDIDQDGQITVNDLISLQQNICGELSIASIDDISQNRTVVNIDSTASYIAPLYQSLESSSATPVELFTDVSGNKNLRIYTYLENHNSPVFHREKEAYLYFDLSNNEQISKLEMKRMYTNNEREFGDKIFYQITHNTPTFTDNDENTRDNLKWSESNNNTIFGNDDNDKTYYITNNIVSDLSSNNANLLRKRTGDEQIIPLTGTNTVDSIEYQKSSRTRYFMRFWVDGSGSSNSPNFESSIGHLFAYFEVIATVTPQVVPELTISATNADSDSVNSSARTNDISLNLFFDVSSNDPSFDLSSDEYYVNEKLVENDISAVVYGKPLNGEYDIYDLPFEYFGDLSGFEYDEATRQYNAIFTVSGDYDISFEFLVPRPTGVEGHRNVSDNKNKESDVFVWRCDRQPPFLLDLSSSLNIFPNPAIPNKSGDISINLEFEFSEDVSASTDNAFYWQTDICVNNVINSSFILNNYTDSSRFPVYTLNYNSQQEPGTTQLYNFQCPPDKFSDAVGNMNVVQWTDFDEQVYGDASYTWICARSYLTGSITSTINDDDWLNEDRQEISFNFILDLSNEDAENIYLRPSEISWNSLSTDDIETTNCAITGVETYATVDGSGWTITVSAETPTRTDQYFDISFAIPPGVVKDLYGNSTNITYQRFWKYGPLDPSINITSNSIFNIVDGSRYSNDISINLTFTLNETNVTLSGDTLDISNLISITPLSNSSSGKEWQIKDVSKTDGNTYTATFEVSNNELVDLSYTFKFDAGVFVDKANNQNLESNSFVWNHDTIIPTLVDISAITLFPIVENRSTDTSFNAL